MFPLQGSGKGGYTQGAGVWHSAAQGIANGTWTYLAFDTDMWDTDTMHDTVVNNSRITCKTAGKYLITFCIGWAGSANGLRYTNVMLNRTTGILATDIQSPGASNTHAVASLVYDLSVNDYIEMRVYQNSGGALNVLSDAYYRSVFAAQKIG